MQPVKKQLEILIINYFRESYAGFPKGPIKPSESPDFVISLRTRNQLGIELTRLNPGNASPPDSIHLHTIERQDHIIANVKALVEKDIPHQLFVKFLFANDERISEELEIITAARIATAIKDAVTQKKESSFFRYSINTEELPAGIDEILLVNHPSLRTSMWERANNLGISNDVVDDIRVSILKKDEKLKLYQKQHLNFYWLLVVTDRLRGVKSFNLHNKIINHKFHSRFQHVFLFDLVKSNVIELV